jgi:hypothetical protein
MVKGVHLPTIDHAHHLHLRDRQNGILYVSMLPVPPVFPPPFTISAAETTGLLALLPVTVILALACDGVVYVISQKRPTTVSKETYYRVKRDLSQ